MAISKAKKVQMVDGYLQNLSRSQVLILAEYRGITVADITALRARVREVGGGIQVVKNTLFKRAMEQLGIPATRDQLTGPLAIGYCYGDVPALVKALIDFAKENENLRIMGAFYGKSYLNAEGARALATLPPREVILGHLLGTVQSPLSSLVGTIAAPMRELVQVLQARSEQAAA